MKLEKTPLTFAALAALCSTPAYAQSTVTMQAESMTLSSYTVEGGNRIKLSAASGTATKSFGGPAGTYHIKVNVIAESDGQPTLKLYKGSTLLQSYTYPRSATNTSFTVNNVALGAGEAIRLVGGANGDAWARVDSLEFIPVSVAAPAPSASTPTASTMQAESMSLSSYNVEGGNRIKLSAASGSASKSFAGASGNYDIKVNVIAESDGQPTLELYKGATRLQTYTYPRTTANTSFTVSNVALGNGETIRLVGRADGDAWARVDSLEFTPSTSTSATQPAPTTPIVGDALGSVSPVTIEAEGMSLSSYVVEGGNRIKLNAATGSASKGFPGASGNYDVQVHVIAESDGQPTLELHRGSTKLQTYTYPKTNTNTSFTVNNVAVNSGDTLRLVGRANGTAYARVDKIVLTPASTATPTPTAPTPTPTPTPTAPADPSACANPAGGYEGFGGNTTGGAGKPVYRVTSLNDSGAGTLRDALSQGNRCVVFDIGGTVALSSNLLVKGSNVTIDGLTAPSPGVTLKGGTLVMQGSSGAGNVVVRGIRHRGAPSGADGIRVYNASNIVIDRVSVSGYGDGGIDVTENAKDVTIQWSIVGQGGSGAPAGNANLIAYGAHRVTVHKNLYIASNDRHPYCGVSDAAKSLSSELVCDVRNNVIWDFKVGTTLQDYGKANVVNNYYYSTRAYSSGHGIWNDGTANAYVAGNVSKNGWHINGTTQSTAFSAAVPGHTDALTAAQQVLAGAGARGPKFGLDSTDQGYIGQVSLQ